MSVPAGFPSVRAKQISVRAGVLAARAAIISVRAGFLAARAATNSVRAELVEAATPFDKLRANGGGLGASGGGLGASGGGLGASGGGLGASGGRLGASGRGVATSGKWVVAALLAVSLTACGNKDDKKVATQVAVKVGSEEISVHQINQVLSRTNAASATPQAVQTLRREVLEKLIDQQLAVDQAVESKLNRTPEVVALIEAARREVLARAYIQQVTSALPKPTAEETKKYFADHPALFAERRVFNLQEVQLPASAGAAVAEQVRALLAAGKPMEEVATFLKSKDLKFGGGAATRAAEQIPLELLTKVHALKDGQSLVIENPQGFNVLRVAASQSAPVPEASALPRIEQFLANQRGAEAVGQSIKQLRAKTTITYMGDFVQGAGAVGAAAQAPATSVPAAATPSAAPAPAPAVAESPAAADKVKSVIEKGVAKLK